MKLYVYNYAYEVHASKKHAIRAQTKVYLYKKLTEGYAQGLVALQTCDKPSTSLRQA